MATYLRRTCGSTASSYTVSMWVKTAKTQGGTTSALWWNAATNKLNWEFNGSSQIYCYTPEARTTGYYRDTSAWYHLVWKVASNVGTLYVNGVADAGLTSVGSIASLVSANDIQIGGDNGGSTFEGIMSHVHFIDGTAYDATAFGEYDANGVWKIKTSPSVTYGTNGFFILKDGNSVTDQSGNSNNFTVGGGTLTNTEDSPSNVFNVWNVLDVVTGTNAPLENGNTTYKKTATGSTTSGSRMGTIGASSGKFYWEFKNKSNIDFITGIIRSNHAPSTGLQGWLANDAGAYGFYRTGTITVGGTVSSGTGMITVLSGNIVGVAVDLDNGKFYSHVNGTYMNSGDPTSGATGTGSLFNISLTNTYMPWVCNQDYNQPNDIEYNFGNGYFGTTAVSSAGTNASGIGIFEYDVPTGYTALSTKGLNL